MSDEQKVSWTDADFAECEQRLLADCVVSGDCRLWTGSVHKNGGYGQISYKGKTDLVHRHMWRVMTKQTDLPLKLRLSRTCRTALCIAKAHIVEQKAREGWTESEWRDLEDYILRNSQPQTSGCRYWTAAMNSDGSGAMVWNNIHTSAQRWAYMARMKLESLPRRIHVRHSCGQAACVQFDHLTTQETNSIAFAWTAEKLQCARRKVKAVVRITPDGHWLFKGNKSKAGYAMVPFRGKTFLLHRLSYIAHHGEIPRSAIVRHKCRERLCCAPHHLETGTHKDNAADMRRDGTMPHGGRHHWASITEDLAHRIKYSKGSGTQAERAARFGVKKGIVAQIDAQNNWAHL